MWIAAYARACLVAMLALMPVSVIVASGCAFAQEAIVIAPQPSPWAAFWSAIQAPLAVFVTAVLGAAGTMLAGVVRRKFGAEAELAFNETYRIATDAAAGWMATKLVANPARNVDEGSPTLAGAVRYVRASWPETRSIEPDDAMLAKDIAAAFGRLKAGG